MVQTSYHCESFDRNSRARSIENAVRAVSQFPQDVGLVFTGVSGMAIGFPVADRTGRDFAVVRKKGDSAHATQMVEGYSCNKYVIIDDFIASGSTIARVMEEMKAYTGDAECVGIVLYGSWSKREKWDEIPILNHTNDFKLKTEIPLPIV